MKTGFKLSGACEANSRTRSRRFLAGFAVLFVVVIFSLTGCRTIFQAILDEEKVETEISKQLLTGASNLLFAQNNGLNKNQFKAAMERQFPGLSFLSDLNTTILSKADAYLTYQEKKYYMEFTATYDDNGVLDRVTSVKSCVELQKKKKE